MQTESEGGESIEIDGKTLLQAVRSGCSFPFCVRNTPYAAEQKATELYFAYFPSQSNKILAEQMIGENNSLIHRLKHS